MWESFAPRNPVAALGQVSSGAQGREGLGQRLSLSSVSSWPALWGGPGLVRGLRQPSLKTQAAFRGPPAGTLGARGGPTISLNLNYWFPGVCKDPQTRTNLQRAFSLFAVQLISLRVVSKQSQDRRRQGLELSSKGQARVPLLPTLTWPREG